MGSGGRHCSCGCRVLGDIVCVSASKFRFHLCRSRRCVGVDGHQFLVQRIDVGISRRVCGRCTRHRRCGVGVRVSGHGALIRKTAVVSYSQSKKLLDDERSVCHAIRLAATMHEQAVVHRRVDRDDRDVEIAGVRGATSCRSDEYTDARL